MALQWVRARFSCDECGKTFDIDMDPAMDVTGFIQLHDIVLFAADGDDPIGFSLEPCVVSAGKSFCPECPAKDEED